jgi:hypothetical protein
MATVIEARPAAGGGAARRGFWAAFWGALMRSLAALAV